MRIVDGKHVLSAARDGSRNLELPLCVRHECAICVPCRAGIVKVPRRMGCTRVSYLNEARRGMDLSSMKPEEALELVLESE